MYFGIQPLAVVSIYSQGGGIFKFKDPSSGKEKFYWYGVHNK